MKDNLAQTKYYSELLDFYGRLLTDSQREIMSDYYLYDLSLSEISENRAISRSAASDTIRKASKKLELYEEKMGLLKIFQSCKEQKSELQITLIAEIEGKIKNGI